jgi:hypothetical protein
MSDDDWYSPNYRPPEARRNRPAGPVWSLWVAGVTGSCELRFHGESAGWAAQVFRNGALFATHGAFALKGDAIRWAEEQRKDAERGYLE